MSRPSLLGRFGMAGGLRRLLGGFPLGGRLVSAFGGLGLPEGSLHLRDDNSPHVETYRAKCILGRKRCDYGSLPIRILHTPPQVVKDLDRLIIRGLGRIRSGS